MFRIEISTKRALRNFSIIFRGYKITGTCENSENKIKSIQNEHFKVIGNFETFYVALDTYL